MKLGISGGREYQDLDSEILRIKHMNGLRRCKAHGILVEDVPCEKCKSEGKTETYEDWFLFPRMRLKPMGTSQLA